MRIYAVADIHAKRRRLDQIAKNVNRLKPDLLVVAGDLTHYRSSSFVVDQLTRLPVPVFAIRGNTDRKMIGRQIAHTSSISSKYLPPTPVCPFAFVGIDGTVPIPFRSRIAFREIQVLKKISPLVNRNTVLVVHPPPWGILDEVLGKFSAGSKNLLAFVRHTQPAVVLCGHIHERPGVRQLRKTHVINCTMGNGSRGACIDCDDDNLQRLKIKLLYK